MAEVTFRVGLGRPLTYQEADDNFRFVEEQAVSAANSAAESVDASTSAIAAGQTAQSASDSAQAASASAAESSALAESAKDASEDARDDAVAAAGAIGPIKFFDTYADAVAGIGTIPEGWQALVLNDETRGGSRTQYKPVAGALEFTVNLDRLRLDLLSPDGASRINWEQDGVGAVVRSILDKLRESVSVADFGAVGNGANDTPAFAKAFAKLGAAGGTVHYFAKHTIDDNLTVPPNVTLKGPMSLVGSPGINTSAPYGNMAALIVSPTATITLSSGSGIDGALIYRKGMTFPAANSQSFAGTAITAAGDDCFAINSQVLGFNKAYYSNGFQRPRIQNFWFDCVNGIEVQTCYDVSHIRNCHGWPFATIAQYAIDTTQKSVIQRSGNAFYFHDVGDWNKVTDCFAYAYFRGFMLVNVDSMTLLSCSADSTGGYTGQYGFLISGTSLDTRLSLCQSAGQDIGYYIDTGANTHTRMDDCDSWACTNHGVLNANGDMSINGGTQRNTANGITIANSSATVQIDDIRFTGISNRPINITVANKNINIGDENDYGSWPAGQSVVPVANKTMHSQEITDPVSIGANIKSVRLLAGAAGFGSINAGWAGREVTFYFSAPVIVYHGGSSPAGLKLSGAANFSAIADSTLTLKHDGSYWYEVGRKV